MRYRLARCAAPAIAALALAAGSAAAQAPDGADIYARNCAICHGPEGRGTEVFPSFVENPNLEDAGFIATVIHQGIVNMPPVPWFTDADIAAVATYVRTRFGNAYGPVTPEEVAAARAELDPVPEIRTIWDGVYTEAQAEHGETVARGACGLCHGSRFNGVPDDNDMSAAPPLARHKFLLNWDNRPLGAVYTYSHMTMPLSNPGFLPAEDYAALVAYMLSASGAPPGDTPLPADAIALGAIRIEPKP
jgi:mono/diheme cytochrome c family protein